MHNTGLRVKTQMDKLMIYAAYFYVVVPFLIFLVGWLRWYYSVPLLCTVLASLVLSLKEYKRRFINIPVSNRNKRIIAVICIVFIWVAFSGIGGFSYQTWDHHFRNAVFRDLVTHKWPVIYHVNGFGATHPLEGRTCMLAYYIGFWLPAAAIGKIFGWHAANVFLFFWTVAGVVMIFYFICRMMRVFSLRLLLIFIFWGTLYVIGLFVKYPLKTLIQSEAVLWAGNLFYADNNTGLLYWVFNQSVMPWLIIVIILNQVPKKNILFLFGICFFHGPLACLGLFPFIVYITFKECFEKRMALRCAIMNFISFQNIGGSLVVMIISSLFFLSNSAAQRFIFVPRNLGIYSAFVLLSFGIPAMLMFHKYRKEPLFYISIFILLILPFFQLGYGLDFCARVSIPPMLILMLLVMKYLFEDPPYFRKKILIACLLISAILPSLQILRSVTLTTLQYLSGVDAVLSAANKWNNPVSNKIASKLAEASSHNLLVKDDFYTIDNPINYSVVNFIGPVDDSFFYQNLVKKGE